MDLAARWRPRGVAVTIVYIREAHARDVWPIGDDISSAVTAPRTNAERCRLALQMCKALSLDLPVLVDPVEDSFESSFAPWPFRFYVVDREARLRYKSQPTKDLTHCPVELESALGSLVAT